MKPIGGWNHFVLNLNKKGSVYLSIKEQGALESFSVKIKNKKEEVSELRFSGIIFKACQEYHQNSEEQPNYLT